MEELDAGGITAVFAANAQLDVGTGLLAELNSHLDELAYAVLINACKGIALEDLLFIILQSINDSREAMRI